MEIDNLPKRKQIGLENFDYSSPGAYFITICTHNRECILSDIVGEGLCALPKIKLTDIGKTIENALKHIGQQYGNIWVDRYVIMPDHIHMIIIKQTGGHGDPPLQVCDVIGRFKSFTTHQYGHTLWQRSFYDHIIRNEKEYLKICDYIENNPLNPDTAGDIPDFDNM